MYHVRLAEIEIVGNGDVPLCALAVVNVYAAIKVALLQVAESKLPLMYLTIL